MSVFGIQAWITGKDGLTPTITKLTGNMRSILGGGLRSITGIARQTTDALKGIVTPLSVLGTGAAVAGLGAMVKSYTETTDELSKFSRQMGFSINSFRQLEYAANAQGVPQDKFRASIRKLNLSMGQLRDGTGGLKTFLDGTLPSFGKQLAATKSNEEALRLLAAKIWEIKDPSRQAMLAQAAFGEEGMIMTRMAEGGVEQIEALVQAHIRLRGVLDEKAGPAAEDFGDRLNDMGQAAGGLKDILGSRLVPIFRPLVARFTDFIVANRELIGTGITKFFGGLANALADINFERIVGGAQSFVGAIQRGWQTIGGFSGTATGLAVILGVKLVGALGAAATGFSMLSGLIAANPIIAAVTGIAVGAGLIVAYWEPISGFFSGLWEDVKGVFSGWMDGFLDSQFIQGFRKVMGGIKRIFGSWADLFRGPISAAKELFNLFTGFLERVFYGAIKDLVDDLKFLWKGFEKAIGAMWWIVEQFFEGGKTVIVGVLDAIMPTALQGAWEDFKSGLRETWDGIKDIFQGAWTTIEPIVTKIRDALREIRGLVPDSIGAVDDIVRFRASAPDEDARRRVRDFLNPTAPGAAPRVVPPALVASAGAEQTVRSEVVVRLEGQTEGARVTSVHTSGRRSSVTTNVGRRSLAYGGP